MGQKGSKKTIELGRDYWYVERELGRGAFGRVHLLVHSVTGSELALKMMDKRLLLTRGVGCVQGALGERQILSSYSAPFQVNLKASLETVSHLLVILDYISGGSLEFHLTQRRFSETETRWIAACLVLALEDLAAHNVIHRDIKPGNILFEGNGYVRLTDFNCARICPKGGALRGCGGTLEYIAPEVLVDCPYAQTADLWSFGVLLYKTLTGRTPWSILDNKKSGIHRRHKRSRSIGTERDIHDRFLSSADPFTKGRICMITQSDIPKLDATKFSPECADFVFSLLDRDPSKRPSIYGLRSHLWFKDLNWDEMVNKTLTAPFVPKTGSANMPPDVLYEQQFGTSAKVEPSAKRRPLTSDEQSIFDGWVEWVAPELYSAEDLQSSEISIASPLYTIILNSPRSDSSLVSSSLDSSSSASNLAAPDSIKSKHNNSSSSSSSSRIYTRSLLRGSSALRILRDQQNPTLQQFPASPDVDDDCSYSSSSHSFSSSSSSSRSRSISAPVKLKKRDS